VVERQPDLLGDTLGRGWLSLSLLSAEGAHNVTRPWPFHWRTWFLPVLLAIILHLGMLWLVMGQMHGPAFPVAQTIRVTLVNLASPRKEISAKLEEAVKPLEKPEPVVQEVKPRPEPLRKTVKQPVAASIEPEPAPTPDEAAEPLEASEPDAQPAIPDSRPDYRTISLHNPPPPYPNAARRRGLQGRVLLHVEVMAAGHCGHIEVQHSSGHEILDEAAIEAVKEWQFIPATHFGFAVTRWMHIPIRFELTARE